MLWILPRVYLYEQLVMVTGGVMAKVAEVAWVYRRVALPNALCGCFAFAP